MIILLLSLLISSVLGKIHAQEAQPLPALQASTCCRASNQSVHLQCGLTSRQLQKRKEGILKNLKREILDTKELVDGFAFRFSGSDRMVDQLTAFIKAERDCCSFFVFGMSVSGDKREAWLEITGPEGSKDFISDELGLVD
jgi:hypothetical protein